MLWQWKCTAALALTLCSALPPHPSPPCALHMLVLSPSCLFLIQRVQWQGMWGEPCFPSFLTTVVGQRSTFSSQQHTFPYIQCWNSIPQCWWLTGRSPSRLMTSSVGCIRGRILEEEEDSQPQLLVFHPDHHIRQLWCCLLPWSISSYCPILTAEGRTV